MRMQSFSHTKDVDGSSIEYGTLVGWDPPRGAFNSRHGRCSKEYGIDSEGKRAVDWSFQYQVGKPMAQLLGQNVADLDPF